MSYTTLATARTPGLVIYLIDVGRSMDRLLGAERRIDVVTEALRAVLRSMIARSTKGVRISPRYRVAMFAYSDEVYDLLGGLRTVDQIAGIGMPKLSPMQGSNTARGFAAVRNVLTKELPTLQRCPAPLVCHFTAGEYDGDDPEPIAQQIMRMSVPDGNVLVENVFFSEAILDGPVADILQWSGITRHSHLRGVYAQKMRSMSSPLPASHYEMMLSDGYEMSREAVMMLPATDPGMIEMAFVMSAATPTAR